MFIFSFIFVKHLKNFQVQSLFVIKFGNILTSRNMLVVYEIHTFLLQRITLHFIYSFFTWWEESLMNLYDHGTNSLVITMRKGLLGKN
jgi:hypothetical protein